MSFGFIRNEKVCSTQISPTASKLLLEKHQMSDCGRDQIFTGMNKVQFFTRLFYYRHQVFLNLIFRFRAANTICMYYHTTVVVELW